jgi:predicted TPR repeat methyltransferase
MPSDMVLALFENYAPFFDEHLVENVSYQGPRLLRTAVDRCRPVGAFDILDLGCGTGLCGTALRDRARRLVGVDISSRMLDRARQRGVYDELIRGDVVDVMNESTESYDLILAADLFVYLGSLEAVIPACARILRPGGLLAVVVEAADGEGYQLRSSRRYAHSAGYLRRLAGAAGLSELLRERSFLRKEADGECLGEVFVYSWADMGIP